MCLIRFHVTYLVDFFFRKFNYKFPQENVLQFLHGLEKVQTQGCLWLHFGSENKFTFSQLSLTPDGLSFDKMRTYVGDTILRCYIVSIGIKYIQVSVLYQVSPDISATKKGTRGGLGPPRRSQICHQKVPNLTSEGPKLYLRSNNGIKKEENA